MPQATCPPTPHNKEKYISAIGEDLVNAYGKKEFYSPEEVRESHQKKKRDYDWDYSCWAMSIFSNHEDFDEYHRMAGESCDYNEMRQEMLGGSESGIWETLISLPDFNADGSWIYLTDTMSSITDGVGSLFSGLADLFDL